MSAPSVSVVVACRGHAEVLAGCLRSLVDQADGVTHETIVVDSASDPHVAAVVRGFTGVRLERGDADLLPGAARNLGVQRGRGTHVAFLDADCRAEPGWLREAVAGLSEGAEMVGGPVLDALPWHPIAVADNMLQFADFRPRRPSGPARYFPACNMALPRASFLAVGGFPTVGLAAGEDTSLCDLVAQRWPDRIRFRRRMRVRHIGRTGLGGFLRHQVSFGYTRGVLGLHLRPGQRRWGTWALSIPAVVLKRAAYVAGRNLRWDPLGAPRTAVLLPLMIVGLCAWAAGFRRGCCASARAERESLPRDDR